LAVSLVAMSVAPPCAHAGKGKAAKRWGDLDEMDAREAFAAGNYKIALDIYAKLYAEKLHPTFLRNIGRCYQNLGEPERAISSFREYLRKAKSIPADERAEVEGYIAEMEALQKQQAAAAAPPPPPAQPLPAAPPPVTPPPLQPAGLAMQPAPVVTAQAPPAEPTPLYKRAWFWGLVGGVVVAGTLGGLWAGGVFSAESNNSCPQGYDCGL